MKPNQEKKKTRPYMPIGLSRGIDRAFLLMGLMSGSVQSTLGLKPTILVNVSVVSRSELSGRYCQAAMALIMASVSNAQQEIGEAGE